MINLDWSRWIFASISKHFDDKRNGIPLIIEGQDPLPLDRSERAELRLNGPFFRNPYSQMWFIDVSINTLLTIFMDDVDTHKPYRILGTFLGAYTDSICVYRYGDGPNDSQQYFGSLTLRRNLGDDIIVSQFGQIGPDIRALQITLDATYKMTFDLNDIYDDVIPQAIPEVMDKITLAELISL